MRKSLIMSAAIVLLTIPAMAVGMQTYHPGEMPAMASNVTPPALQGVGVTQHPGQQLNLNLQFTESNGQAVKLGQFFHQGHPVVMAMVYYRCRNLCGMLMSGLANTFKKLNVKAGKFYDVVIVSMDHTETPQIAAAKKAEIMKILGVPGADKYWHFLVGNKANVDTLANEFGFKFKWDAQLNEFAHSTVIYIVTASGAISRYIFGIDFAPKTMRLSLVQAGQGRIGTLADEITLCCFRFSPNGNKYVLWSFNLMRIACVFTVIVLLMVFLPVWFQKRKHPKVDKPANASAGS